MNGFMAHRLAAIAMALAFCAPASAAAQDVLVFHNGDRLTGTIRRIQRGVVAFLALAIDGEVQVGWDRVLRVESNRTFQFVLADGRTVTGRIGTPPESEADVFVIEQATSATTVSQRDIVYVSQTLGPSRGLLEMDLGGGFSAESNDQKQANAHGLVEYETSRFSITGRFNSVFSTQLDTSDTNHHSVTGSYRHRVGRRWHALAFTDYLTSREQNLGHRVVVGGGPVRDLITNDRFEIRALGGIVWNNEEYRDVQQASRNSIEAVAGVDANIFEFKQIALNTALFVYSSLSEQDRVRLDWRAQLRLRLVKGQPFWLNLNQSSTYDSRPPTAQSRIDYVLTTSVSWLFP